MHRFLKAFALSGLVAVSAACSDVLFDERDQIYDGPPVIEFAPTVPEGSYSVSASFPAGSEGSETLDLRVNYIAPPPDSPINGSFQVTDGNAVDGQHFSLPGGTDFTIPAGENFTDVEVQLLGSGLSDGESVSLTLELQDGEEYEASANYRQFEIQVSKGG